MKKAEVSWQLVTMIIALIALIIIIYIFSKQSGRSADSITGLGSCMNQGQEGECVEKASPKRNDPSFSCYYGLSPCGKNVKGGDDYTNKPYCCFKPK